MLQFIIYRHNSLPFFLYMIVCTFEKGLLKHFLLRTLKREKWFLMWQHKSGSQIKCQSYFHSNNKICWQHQSSSHLLRDLDTKKCKLLRFYLLFGPSINDSPFLSKKLGKNDDPQVWKVVICGREGLERQGGVTYGWPLSKTSLQKTQRSKSCFVVRDVSHIHMYVLMHSG